MGCSESKFPELASVLKEKGGGPSNVKAKGSKSGGSEDDEELENRLAVAEEALAVKPKKIDKSGSGGTSGGGGDGSLRESAGGVNGPSTAPASQPLHKITELPDSILKILRKSRIDWDCLNENLDVLCNVLRFTHKLRYRLELSDDHPCSVKRAKRLAERLANTEDRSRASSGASDAGLVPLVVGKSGSKSGNRSRSRSRSEKSSLATVKELRSPRRSPRTRTRAASHGTADKSQGSPSSLKLTPPLESPLAAAPFVDPEKRSRRSRKNSHKSKQKTAPLSDSGQDMAPPPTDVDLSEMDHRLEKIGELALKQAGEALQVNPTTLFSLASVAGKGGFGAVWKAKDRTTKESVALKRMYHNTAKQAACNCNEIGCLTEFDHPNIVSFLRCLPYEEDGVKECWVVMEFLDGGTLSQASKVQKFNPKQIAFVAKEMFKALSYIHSKGFAHRDLKSQNVMLSVTAQVKLIDFGLAANMTGGPKRAMVGSPFWMPPEMIRGSPYSFNVDVWSTGVSLVEMLTGKVPGRKGGRVKAMFLVATEGMPTPKKVVGTECAKFLEDCLQMTAAKRPSATEMLNHPFLRDAEERNLMMDVLREVFLKVSLQKLN